MNPSLPLHEEVMLLALKDEKGTIDYRANFYPQVMAGAILSELLVSEAIQIVDDKKQIVECYKTQVFENAVLNEALQKIENDSKKRPLKHWVSSLAGLKDLKKKTAESLCEKGILDQVSLTILWVFNTTHYPELNGEYEKKLIERLEDAINSEMTEIDFRTAALIALLHKTQILTIPFSKQFLKERKERITEIADGKAIAGVTAEIIQSIQAVIFITAIMPAITVTTIT